MKNSKILVLVAALAFNSLGLPLVYAQISIPVPAKEVDTCKPPSTGDVKVNGRQILVRSGTQYQTYYVKGMGYAPAPIGTFPGAVSGYLCRQNGNPPPDWDCNYNLYNDANILARDFPAGPNSNLGNMRANTIRTWGGDVTQLLTVVNQTGKRVLAGFWLNHDTDYINQSQRTAVKTQFRQFVRQTKAAPNYNALFGYGIFNENNVDFCTCGASCNPCNLQAQKRAFYSLINEMGWEAYLEEGANYKPIVTVFAGLGDIGDASVGADDNSLCNIDIHGSNDYLGATFTSFNNPALPLAGNLFSIYETKSNKPLLITEFGTDAMITTNPNTEPGNPMRGIEDGDIQAKFIGYAWDDIARHSVYATGTYRGRINSGGFVLGYTDIWWRGDQVWNLPRVSSHELDYPIINGWPWAAGQPDGYINEEWLGVFSIQRNPAWTVTNQLPDIITPRAAYNMLNTKW